MIAAIRNLNSSTVSTGRFIPSNGVIIPFGDALVLEILWDFPERILVSRQNKFQPAAGEHGHSIGPSEVLQFLIAELLLAAGIASCDLQKPTNIFVIVARVNAKQVLCQGIENECDHQWQLFVSRFVCDERPAFTNSVGDVVVYLSQINLLVERSEIFIPR
ncbi:MAG TPA: hypothetical protein VGF82_05390 [Terracidiphilus sp.]|jgi:hypothetical protein